MMFLSDEFFFLQPLQCRYKPYRIPYQGSKQQIAKNIMDCLILRCPTKKYFIDLFGGGGSMSFYALHCGFKRVFYNEILKSVVDLIKEILSGESGISDFSSKYWKFVTREEFEKIKKDKPSPYNEAVLVCYSFSTNRTSYYCKPEVEIIKHKLHDFLIFNDYDTFIKDYFKDRCNVNDKYLLFWDRFYELVSHLNPIDKRQILNSFLLKFESCAVTNIFNDWNPDFDLFIRISGAACLYIIKEYAKDLEVKETQIHGTEFKEPQQITRLKQIKNIQSLQNLEQLHRLEQLQRLEQLAPLNPADFNLELMNYDYKVALSLISEQIDLKDAIIYCDIPYRGTSCRAYGNIPFDHEGFYDYIDYLRKNNIDVYFSEYNSNYKEVWSYPKRSLGKSSTLTGGGIERVFINKKQ